MLRSIHRIIDILKENPQFGDPIRKQLIPQKFLEMGIQNLYRAELSNYWRMLYTLEGTQIEIFCFVLSIMDHKEYDHLFGYNADSLIDIISSPYLRSEERSIMAR